MPPPGLLEPIGGGSASSGGAVVPSLPDLKKSIWHMHQRMVIGNLLLSMLLLYTVAIVAYTHQSDAHMFSFGWSNRIIDLKGRDDIYAMYRENRDVSDARMDEMLKKALDIALCKPVAFNGGLQWNYDEVSPTCNCIRNMHVEYVKSVTPNGVRLWENIMNRSDSVLNTKWISNRMRVECFQNLRHTQVNGYSL